MAGLLDAFMGDTPERAQMMNLLSGDMMMGNGARRGLLDANNYAAGSGDRRQKAEMEALKMQYQQAQLAEVMSQIEDRKSKATQAQTNAANRYKLLNGDPNGLSTGAFLPPADGQGPVLPVGSAPMQGGLIGYGEGIGVPRQAMQADEAFNGGKGISDMLFKRGTPDMQVTNGYAYDKNRTGAGFMPQLSTSQDGKATMIRIGPDGMPVVSAPTGAQETYAGYRNIDEGTKANFDPQTVTPQGQPPQLTSRGALMRNPLVQGKVPTRADTDRIAILNQEVTRAKGHLETALRSGDQTAAARATNDLTALSRELKGAGGGSATVGMPLQSKAEEVAATKQAEADVMPAQQRQAAISSAGYLNSVIDMALKHPGLPKATGLQGTIDPRNYMPGTDATNFKAVIAQIQGSAFLQAFQSLKGGGQITEVEGKKATDAIARLSTAQSTEEFTKALEEFQGVINGGLARLEGRTLPPKEKLNAGKTVVRTGTYQGKKVIQYSDGSTAYAD